MTVPAEILPLSYIGDGIIVEFPYTFMIRDKTWLKVYVDDVLKALDTHYTVTDVGEETGGNVVFTVLETPAEDAMVRIVTNVAYTQLIEFPPGASLSEETLGYALDKLTILLQQLKTLINSMPTAGSDYLGRLITDPDTTAWTVSEGGKYWFNRTDGLWKGWNGYATVQL